MQIGKHVCHNAQNTCWDATVATTPTTFLSVMCPNKICLQLNVPWAAASWPALTSAHCSAATSSFSCINCLTCSLIVHVKPGETRSGSIKKLKYQCCWMSLEKQIASHSVTPCKHSMEFQWMFHNVQQSFRAMKAIMQNPQGFDSKLDVSRSMLELTSSKRSWHPAPIRLQTSLHYKIWKSIAIFLCTIKIWFTC